VSHAMQALTQTRLGRGDQAKLRNLIQGQVAAMTAELLSIDLDTGLEHDARFAPAISAISKNCALASAKLHDLLTCLDSHLPQPCPLPVKVLVIEAAARQLGRDWLEDMSSFIDVTIASARLQDMGHALAMEAANRTNSDHSPLVTIFLPRSEQHSLMCHLTGALFQTFGWQQQVLIHGTIDRAHFEDAAAKSDAICIGWSNIRLKREVRELIRVVKSSSAEKKQPVIAGGSAALNCVDFLVEMGIDCICDSAYSAVKIASSFNKLEKTGPAVDEISIRANKINIRNDWQAL